MAAAARHRLALARTKDVGCEGSGMEESREEP